MTERRPSSRTAADNRPIDIQLDFQANAYASVLISTGKTRVICSASVEPKAPRWMDRGDPRGWVTAEYSMLPGSGNRRVDRRTNARATEIQRLIGRSLRGAVDLTKLTGHTITIDCDVLDADGGTRTASVTGGWLALKLACRKLVAEGAIKEDPLTRQLAAVSVGIVGDGALCDLDYIEDSAAETDMNVVGTSEGALIEVQGTAEGNPFSREELNQLMDLAQAGIQQLVAAQNEALAR